MNVTQHGMMRRPVDPPGSTILSSLSSNKRTLYIVCFIAFFAISMKTFGLVDPSHCMDNVETRTIMYTPETLSDQDVPKRSPKEMLYLAKSTPLIVPAGAVILKNKHLQVSAEECLGPFCHDKPIQSDNTVPVEGDVIVSQLHSHYFHFVYETLLRSWGLHLHGVLEKYPNSSILWFGGQSLLKQNIDMMKAIWPEFPINRSIFGKPNTQYQVDHLSTMIVTRHNDYHSKKSWQDYNFWLMNSIRETLKIVDNPKEELFISRRGIRRGIAREDELYKALKSSILPNLRIVLPDNFSVAEQAQIFANAKLIIAPHGGSLTNALFSNWDKMILIEFTKANSGGSFATFRMDLQVRQHYLLKCQSVPCNGTKKECDPWNTQIDANVQNATKIIQDILLGNQPLRGDIFVRADQMNDSESDAANM